MTALWAVYQRGHKRFVEVVLMMDGDETSGSNELFEQAAAPLAESGTSTRQQFEHLCAPTACSLLKTNGADLRQAFGKVKSELEGRAWRQDPSMRRTCLT